MNNNQQDKSIKDNVLAAIESGKVKMRPKWHFVLRAALLISGTILAGLTLLYMASFIIFILRQTGMWFAPGFGFRGAGVFLVSLPWLLILLAIIFILILEILVKHYSFGYRKPLLYSAVVVIVFVLFGGFAVAKTSFHRGLFERARDHHLPIAGGLYRSYGIRKFGNIEAGIVIEKIEAGYRIQNRGDELIEILVTSETQFPFGSDIALEDSIVVLGERNGDSVNAKAIRKIDGFPVPPPPGFRDFRRPPR